MSATSFEVKFEEPKAQAPEALLSPRSRDANEVKLRVQSKQTKAQENRKSQIETVVEKQKKHVSNTFYKL